MEAIVELVCKLIEHMRVVSKPGEQNQSLTCAAPIQDLSWTPGSTVTKLTLCPEVSHLQTLFIARSRVAKPDAADPTGMVVAFQTFGPSSAPVTRLPRMPSAIRTFHFPMTNLLVFKVPNETQATRLWRAEGDWGVFHHS
jgi:hypothetical protein